MASGSVASRPDARGDGADRSAEAAGGLGTERSASSPSGTARPRARNAGSDADGRFDADGARGSDDDAGAGEPVGARGDGADGGDANDDDAGDGLRAGRAWRNSVASSSSSSSSPELTLGRAVGRGAGMDGGGDGAGGSARAPSIARDGRDGDDDGATGGGATGVGFAFCGALGAVRSSSAVASSSSLSSCVRRDAMGSFTLVSSVRAPVPAAPPEPAPVLDDRWRAAQRYQPFFCEENVWHLVTGDALPRPRAAVFITSTVDVVAMWGQRAAAADPILWDYHVVALLPEHGLVVDLDDRDAVLWDVDDWLAHAFRPLADPGLAPLFRVVDESALRRTFSTDRRHMYDDAGAPQRPFPSWPAPWQPALGMTLPRFLDPRDDFAGVVVDADGLSALCDPSFPR